MNKSMYFKNGKPKKKYMFCLNDGLREMRKLYGMGIIQCFGCRCPFYSIGCGRMELREWEKNNAK